jgi:hypothetical protein
VQSMQFEHGTRPTTESVEVRSLERFQLWAKYLMTRWTSASSRLQPERPCPGGGPRRPSASSSSSAKGSG